MRKPKTLLVVSLGMLAILLVIATFVLTGWQTTYQLSKELDIPVTTAVREHALGVMQRKVRSDHGALRTTWYQTITEIEPIFALPGLDLAEYTKQLKNLSYSADYLSDIYKNDLEAVEKLESTFYPIDFLRSLAVLERLRRQVIEDPDDSVIEQYVNQTQETIQLYQTFIHEYRRFIAQGDYDKTYVYWDGYTNLAQLDLVFIGMLQVAIQELETAHARYQCYLSWGMSCARLSEIEQEYRSWVGLKQLASAPFIDDKTLARAKNNASFLSDLRGGVKSDEILIFELSDRLCTPEDTDVQLFSIFARSNGRFAHRRVDFVHEMYLHDTQSRRTPFLAQINEDEISHELQSLAAYTCMGSGELYGRVLQLHSLLEKTNSPQYFNDLSPYLAADTYVAKLNELRAHDVVTEQAILGIWKQVLFEAQQSGSLQDRRFLYTQLNQFRFRTDTLDELIAWIANSNTQINHDSQISFSNELPSIIETSLMRSYLPILLTNFTWSQEPVLMQGQLNPVVVPLEKRNLVRYSDVQNNLSYEQLKEMTEKLYAHYNFYLPQ